MAEYPLLRHTLVWIAADQEALLRHADDSRAIVANWLAWDRPLIMRRAEGCLAAPAGWVALGLPLPPANGVKRRIAIAAPFSAIRCSAPPPLLRDVIAHAPIAWRVALEDLLRRADACGIALRVFGSAAWQALTGLPYVTAQSDLDLLWRPGDAAQLAAGVALLADWERASGARADGEILFGDDVAVAWREWQQARQNGNAQVLVKSTAQAALMDVRALLTSLPSSLAMIGGHSLTRAGAHPSPRGRGAPQCCLSLGERPTPRRKSPWGTHESASGEGASFNSFMDHSANAEPPCV